MVTAREWYVLFKQSGVGGGEVVYVCMAGANGCFDPRRCSVFCPNRYLDRRRLSQSPQTEAAFDRLTFNQDDRKTDAEHKKCQEMLSGLEPRWHFH